MNKMFGKTLYLGLLLIAVALIGCGTSTRGPAGSNHQTMTGVSESNYPAGSPVDPESPALSSTSEQNHSKPSPKVPRAAGAESHR